jgi:hypothetical protein
MHHLFIQPCAAAVALGLALSLPLRAETVTTTTTSEGTISSFEPESFVIKSETAGPLSYSYSTKTRYIDDSGAVVARDVIRPGVPVTVHYTREGGRMLADRVVVHRVAATAPAVPAETTTTTRTTTVEEPPLTRKQAREEAKHERKMEKEAREHPERAARREAEREAEHPRTVATETVTTETTSPEGTITTFAPDRFEMRTVEDPHPVAYRFGKTTEYVDEEGQPVTMEVVRSGLPVTVRYVREGDGLVAHRVIVHRRGAPPVVRRALPPP